MSGGKPKNEQISTEETMDLIRLQQVMNNPNVTNRFGNTSTTFDANDQASILQTLSPEMEGLLNQQFEHVGRGANQFTPNQNNEGNRLMNQFSDSFSNRMGAPPRPPQAMPKMPADGFTPQPPPMAEQPPQGFAPPQGMLPPEMQVPVQPNINQGGVPFKAMQQQGTQSPDKMQQLLGHLGGNKKSDNPLAQALMNMGGKY